MIKIAICDDNKYALDMMKRCIEQSFKKHNTEFETYCYLNGERLLNDIAMLNFDVIFLDIDMPQINGFEIANIIKRKAIDSRIIFVTIHSEMVYKSFDYHPFYFIKKEPLGELPENVSNVVLKLMDSLKQKQILELLDTEGYRHITSYDKVVYIKSSGHYLNYNLVGEEKVTLRGSINDIEGKYSEYKFARIHKSYIVNLKYVKSMNLNFGKISMSVKDKDFRLSISRTYKESFEKRYFEYMRSMI